jgi:uncharacterized protein YkwD
MSNRLWASALLAICLFCHTSAYAQKVHELQGESTEPGKGSDAAPQSDVDVGRTKELIFSRTNQFRAQEKRAALKTNPQLTEAAQAFAQYLAQSDKFSHTADGKEPWDRTAKAGYQHCIILENIAYEYSSAGFTTEDLASRFVTGWENSPGHRRNLLDPDVQDIGVGLARSSRTGRYYAVQDFGRPKSAMITFKVTNRLNHPVAYTLDGQRYAASPGYTITYERCRPVQLRFSWGEKENVTPAAKEVFQPTNNASYTIHTEEGDRVTVDRR